MSEDSSDYVNMTAFVTVPRGATPDPAKKVCNTYWFTSIPVLKAVNQELCKETEELRRTVDINAGSKYHIL